MKWTKRLLLSGLLIVCTRLLSVGQTYTWSNVRIGGGGLVTSINAHPLVAHLRFATTDVGTAYRWNETLQRWEGLMYSLPSIYWPAACGNLAFAPNDATGNILYATMGKGAVAGSSAGTVLRSTNRGTTWTDCNLPIWTNPNDNTEKVNGERIAVDPNNSSVVYVTTRIPSSASETTTGTWCSTDAGVTWTKIDTLHGRFIVFDTSGGVISGLTKNVYIGTLQGVYKSTDAGTSFSLMSGSPTDLHKAVMRGGKVLYAAKNAAIYKWNDTAWTNISPAATGFAGVEVNPNNSKEIIISTGSFTGTSYKSNNGGSSWTPVKGTRDHSEIPWAGGTAIGNSINDFAWDPTNPTEVWMCDLVNMYQTTTVWSDSAVWKVRAVGDEEVVTAGPMVSPPSGSNLLLTALADMGGFDHKSISDPPTLAISDDFQYQNSQGVHLTGVAMEEANPNFIARVGRRGWSGDGLGGYSTDGGVHYSLWVCPTGLTGGRIAVSATSETMLWAAQGASTYRSTDRGNTWTKITTINGVAVGSATTPSSIFSIPADMSPLAADKVNGNKFYCYLAGKMMVSTDGGVTFTAAYSALPNVGNVANVKVETSPGIEGDVWVSFEGLGLYHSTTSGSSFTKITKVQSAKLMSIGKSAGVNPTIYVFGTVDSIVNVVSRSDNNGSTWTVVANPAVSQPRNLAADRRTYGKIYMASDGNGIFTGDATPGPVTGVTSTPSNVSIAIGQKDTLVAIVSPGNAANKKVHWFSYNTAQVTVNDSTGVIKGIALTSSPVIVKVTTEDSSKIAVVYVTVTQPISVKGIALTPNPDTLGIGSTVTLGAAITPSTASNKTLRWSSSDTTIARVDSITGLIIGISAGTATISARAQDSGYVSTASVYVYHVTPASITVSGVSSLGGADTTTLIATVLPANATNNAITWTSSDTTKAKVNASGRVTAIAAGSVTITATAADGGVTGTKTITIAAEGQCGVLLNPGFESGFAGWMIIGDTVNGNSPVIITSTNTHSGTKAALITGMTGVSTNQFLPVPGVKAVTFTAWARLADGPLWAGFGIDYIDSSGNKITADQFNVTDTVYRQFSVTRITPSNTAKVNIWTAKASASGRMYLDDFCVTVTAAVNVTGVTLSPTPATVAIGFTQTLTPTVVPSTATNKTVTWASSNTGVASVNGSGVVTGVALGTAIITATTNDGGFVAKDTITVIAPVSVTALNLTPDSVSIGVSDSYALVPAFTPSNSSNKTVAYTSTNTAVATVNGSTGVVKAIAVGTAYIKGVSADGSKTDSSVITVVPMGSCGIINNNGFESGLVNWNNGNGVYSITTATADVHSGLRAVIGTGEGTLGYGLPLTYHVGDTMTFTVYGKISGSVAWAGLALDCMGAGGVKLVSAAYTINTTSYTAYTQQFVVPAGTTSLNLWVYKSGAAGILYLDDFCLSVNSSGSMSRTAATPLKNTDAPAADGVLSISAFPNPVQNDINVRIANYKSGRVAVAITDMHGRVVHNELISVEKGTNVYKLHPTRKPATGIYILTVTGDGVRASFKLIVP